MSRAQFFGLLAVVCFGLVATAALTSNAQRVAVGGAGPDILHMGPFLEVNGEETIPVLTSDTPVLFRFYNDGQQAVRIVSGNRDEVQLAKIAPGTFQFVNATHLKVIGTEKDKKTTVFIVHLK